MAGLPGQQSEATGTIFMKKLTFHLIGNAHLDPVWLWDWREGLNEGLITCRTILNLMDEFEELTFIRGESAIYQHRLLAETRPRR